MPTTGKSKVLGISSLRCGTLGERFTEDFMIMGLNGMAIVTSLCRLAILPMFSDKR
jgi:hypothetical protein